MSRIYRDYYDGLEIMFMKDPSEDEWEVYYRIAGYPFIYGFGLPTHDYNLSSVRLVARCNAEHYVEVLFK